MNRLSLRWIILVPLLLTMVGGFVAFGVYIDQSDRATRLAAIDRELARAERGAVAPPPGGPPFGATPPAPPPDVAIVGVEPPVQLTVAPNGGVMSARNGENPFSRDTLAALAATGERTVTEVGDFRILASPWPDGRVGVTALPLSGFRAATDALRRTLMLGGLIIVALEAVLAWTLAGRLIRPLTTMAATANRIAGGALDTDVPCAGGSREVADLSRDVRRMVARLRAALAERERSAAAATQARDDLQRFLADVSHELRTPLTALKGYSDLYQVGMLAEPGALDRAMSRVGSESVRLNGLVTAMLELARDLDARCQTVPDVDAAQVVRAVVDDLHAAYPARRIDLRMAENADAAITGDPARLHQAVLNLGANACTHTDPDTSITIQVESTTSVLTVRVIDHGAGIEEAEREKIFLPFYRTDPSRARDGHGGAGLGLALTQQIAHQHHGSVTVHPTRGGGATFMLHLPLGERRSG